MSDVRIERLGGLAGFGGGAIKSVGVRAVADLSPADRTALDVLFGKGAPDAPIIADGFRYRLSRSTGNGTESVEVPESAVPDALKASVKDQLV